MLGCKPGKLQAELDALGARAKAKALKLKITTAVRDRARCGRYALVHERGQDFDDTIWVIDPVFMLDLVHEQLQDDSDQTPAREEAYFAGVKLADEELRDAAAEDRKRRDSERARQADGERSNLGLGHDINAKLIDPTDSQLHALKAIVCHLIAAHYRELIAYGAGWTDRERQQPVGDTGRYEPRHVDAILDAELQRRSTTPTRSAGSRSSPPAGRPHSCSTPTASPAPKHSAPSESPESSQTRSPAARTHYAPPSGSSSDQSSPPTSHSSTATRSCKTQGSRAPSRWIDTAAIPD